MPTYVRLKIRSMVNNRSIIVRALVSTGFRSESPDISLPIEVARRLNLWPPPENSYIIEAETASGKTSLYLIPRIFKVKVVVDDRETEETVANALINPYDNEILISDMLAERLKIQILYPKSGVWRLADDPPNKTRKSA